MNILKKIFLIGIVVITVFACKKSTNYQQLRDNELELLAQYLSEHNISDDYKKPSGLYYIEVTPGTGDSIIKVGDRIQIYYSTWRLVDSLLVDASGPYYPLEFVVGTGSVISGLDEAATYMKKGTEANLIINSELAYGSSGSGYDIGGFETLLMNVKVHKVYPAQ